MKKHPLRWALAAVVVLTAVAAGCMFSRYGSFGTGPPAGSDEFARYAQPASSIVIPDETRRPPGYE